MKTFPKLFCLALASSMLLGVVGCEKEEGNTPPAPLTQEQAKVKFEQAIEDLSAYAGSWTLNRKEDSFSSAPSIAAAGATTTSTHSIQEKISYNAETKESYSRLDYTIKQRPASSQDLIGSDDTKIVKDGDWYYTYKYVDDQIQAPFYRGSSKMTAANHAKGGDEYVDYLDLSALEETIPWLKAQDFATLSTTFDEIFANDSARKLEVALEEAEKDELSLSVSMKGALSKTIATDTATISVVNNSKLVMKENRLTELTYLHEVTLQRGETQMVERVELAYDLTYEFDSAGFEAFALTNAPDKANIQEGKTTRSMGYKNVMDGYVPDYQFVETDAVDYSKTTAEQVEDFKAYIAERVSQADSYSSDYRYGAILGYYVDEAMTKPLTSSISDAEWEALEYVHVKREAKENIVYIQEDTLFQLPANWDLLTVPFFDLTEKHYTPVEREAPYRYDFEEQQTLTQLGQQLGLTIENKATKLVNGEKTAYSSEDFSEGIYTIEMKITVAAPEDLVSLMWLMISAGY